MEAPPLWDRANRPIVAFGFDDRLARHAIPTITSLSQNSRQDLNVVILARGWKPWTEAYFRSLELERLRISILDMSSILISRNLRLLAHTTAATMDRLYLPTLLPMADRVVYLDVDLICLDDLGPLFELAVADSGIAAKASVKEGYANLAELVRSWARPGDRAKILDELMRDGVPETMSTFNAGVLVMDLQKLRKRSFVQTTVDLVARFGVNDQLAINLYTKGEFARLDASWNVFVGQDTSDAPHIIHWAGPRKPWNSENVAFRRVWDSYTREYDPMRKWIARLFGNPPANPIQRIKTVGGC